MANSATSTRPRRRKRAAAVAVLACAVGLAVAPAADAYDAIFVSGAIPAGSWVWGGGSHYWDYAGVYYGGGGSFDICVGIRGYYSHTQQGPSARKCGAANLAAPQAVACFGPNVPNGQCEDNMGSPVEGGVANNDLGAAHTLIGHGNEY